MPAQTKRLIICDLDNTLYDWVAFFVPSFYAMIDRASIILDCDTELLLSQMKAIHQKHHDVEVPYSLLEAEIVQRQFEGLSNAEIATRLDEAFYAFNSLRKKLLRLHPTVIDSLSVIKSAGLSVVAHTESQLFAVVDRMNRLGLIDYFDRIYCRERPRSIHPNGAIADGFLGKFPMEKVVELSHRHRKPNAEVLLEICDRERARTSDAIYVGDSIARDVMMARWAGVYAVWAKYGAHPDPDLYKKLVKITHWTDEDVEREQHLKSLAGGIDPDFIAERYFSEVLQPLGLPATPLRPSYAAGKG